MKNNLYFYQDYIHQKMVGLIGNGGKDIVKFINSFDELYWV